MIFSDVIVCYLGYEEIGGEVYLKLYDPHTKITHYAYDAVNSREHLKVNQIIVVSLEGEKIEKEKYRLKVKFVYQKKYRKYGRK